MFKPGGAFTADLWSDLPSQSWAESLMVSRHMALIGLNILYVERGYDFNINRLKKTKQQQQQHYLKFLFYNPNVSAPWQLGLMSK